MRKEKIEVEKYVADNGEMFDTENDCIAYEKALKEEAVLASARARVKEVMTEPGKDIPFIPLELFLQFDGHVGRTRTRMRMDVNKGQCHFYRLRDRQDAIALATVLAADDCSDTAPENILKASGPMKYPCTVMVSYSYHFERVMGTFLNEMRQVEKYCRMHGYMMKLEPLTGTGEQ